MAKPCNSLICRTHKQPAKYQPQETTPAVNPRRLVLSTCGFPRDEEDHLSNGGPGCTQELTASTSMQRSHARVARLTHLRESSNKKVEKRNGAGKLIPRAAKRHNHGAERSTGQNGLQSLVRGFVVCRFGKDPVWGAQSERTPEKALFSLTITCQRTVTEKSVSRLTFNHNLHLPPHLVLDSRSHLCAPEGLEGTPSHPHRRGLSPLETLQRDRPPHLGSNLRPARDCSWQSFPRPTRVLCYSLRPNSGPGSLHGDTVVLTRFPPPQAAKHARAS